MAGMTLLQLIDQFDECLGRKDSISSLRAKLGIIREQFELLESRVEVYQARIEDLEAKIKSAQLDREEQVFEDDAEKILDFIFDNPGRIVLPAIGNYVGLSESMPNIMLMPFLRQK